MKKIRQSSFETNSSSAHSISLGVEEGKEFILDTIYPDENGIITLIGGEFGWQWEKSNDPETKANYAAVSLRDHDTLFRVIKDHTQCEQVIYAGSSNHDSENWSYVDHESQNVCPSDYDALKEFIFNKNSWLFLGNDNDYKPPQFYDVPIFRINAKILPKYHYELSIDGVEQKSKFKTLPSKEDLITALHFLLADYIALETGLISKSLYSQLNLNRQIKFSFTEFYKDIDEENGIMYMVRDMDDWKRLNESNEQFWKRRDQFYNNPENFYPINFHLNAIPKR